MKKHNFSAGPSILNQKVFEDSSKAVLELNDIGLSILEISHRSPEFISIMNEARELSLELSGLNSDDYTTLFLQGGASMQFLMIAYNFLKNKGGYINSGEWSTKAIKEAKLFGNVSVYASSEDKNFSYIPKDYYISDNPDYLHITTNNTIFGTQYHQVPNCNCPLFADMSSDIFCRKLDYSKFSLIYAGAQKNLGPAGTTMVILKKSLINEICREVPSMLNYKVHFEKESMFNTPPVFAIYTCLLSMRWLKNIGGLGEIEKKNIHKSSILYEEIDNNEMFNGFASKDDRSVMNVTFNLIDEKYKPVFDNLLKENNISGVNGHRSVGGYRASIYNAMETESVEVLIDTMKKFEKNI